MFRINVHFRDEPVFLEIGNEAWHDSQALPIWESHSGYKIGADYLISTVEFPNYTEKIYGLIMTCTIYVTLV